MAGTRVQPLCPKTFQEVVTMITTTIRTALLASVWIALCSSAVSLAQQTREETDQALRQLTVMEPQQEAVVQAQAAARADWAQRLQVESVISPEAIEQGRVRAVGRGESVAVTAENFSRVATPDRLLIERIQNAATSATPPPALVSEAPEARTYKLSWRAITAQGTWEAWGRDSTGLVLTGPEGNFAGNFEVALVNVQNPPDNSVLDAPIAVAIAAPGALSINPRPLQIDQLGRWNGVSIAVSNPGSNTYEVGVSADPATDGDRIPLLVSRPKITLGATPDTVVGWGIGNSMIDVQADGIRDPEGIRVTLQSSNGTLAEGSVALDAQGFGSVGLRSSRHAGAMISVRDDRYISNSISVGFETPWLYLTLAIAGGLLGAFVKGTGRKQWIKASAIGAASGLLAALIYSVGINWVATALPGTTLAKGGEAVVFVLGAVGAYLGIGKILSSEEKKPAN